MGPPWAQMFPAQPLSLPQTIERGKNSSRDRVMWVWHLLGQMDQCPHPSHRARQSLHSCPWVTLALISKGWMRWNPCPSHQSSRV